MKRKLALTILLTAICGGFFPTRADEYVFTMVYTNPAVVGFQLPPAPDAYYIAYSITECITGAWHKWDMKLGATADQYFNLPATSMIRYFRFGRMSTATPADADGDGIDDVYELNTANFNPLNSVDALQDFDQDGFDNRNEYNVRANPNWSNPPPAIDITYPRDGARLP